MQYTIKSDKSVVTVMLFGSFDLKGRKDYLSALQQANAENTQSIIIDLQEVTYVDSAAIGLLMITYKDYKAASVVLRLCLREGTVKKTLEMMKITDFIPVVSR